MLEISNVEVYGLRAAIRGMRNSWKSWELSDTDFDEPEGYIGKNDLNLMLKLIRMGPSHRKFRRMITATFDVAAPEYWWKQFDTYKIGTVSCSTSTMHTIMSRPLEYTDFSCEWSTTMAMDAFDGVLDALNYMIRLYEGMKEPELFNDVIRLLPMSYNYTRTISTNYEVLSMLLEQRKGHKLKEWSEFALQLMMKLPYTILLDPDGLYRLEWEAK